jgi:hypothetical protein
MNLESRLFNKSNNDFLDRILSIEYFNNIHVVLVVIFVQSSRFKINFFIYKK